MKPLRLYIEDFMCYSHGFIDFTQFNSALIVGKIDNSELYSNGVGKTTIFKAIEYVLFNQAIDLNLEMVIREDTAICRVVFDFVIDKQEYRLSRSRTVKGITDVTFLKRNTIDGPDEEVYHTLEAGDIYNANIKDEFVSKYWKDIGGRRAADTERELSKLIKTNFGAFRSTLHFIQNDFTGLSTVTPSKRKGILREAFGLAIYDKLEKIAKERASILSKDIEKHSMLLDNIGTPELDLVDLRVQLVNIDAQLNNQQELLNYSTKIYDDGTIELNGLAKAHSVLESKFASLLVTEKSLNSEKNKFDTLIKEYQTKKSNIIKVAQELVLEVKNLKEQQVKLALLDYSQIDIFMEKISELRDDITKNNLIIQNNLLRYDELKIPVPDDNICKHCRQTLTPEHKQLCKAQVTDEIKQCQVNIQAAKKSVTEVNAEILKAQQIINGLNLSKKKLEDINVQITNKSKEIQDKKSLHDEYKQLLNKFTANLALKIKEIEDVKEELKNSSIEEANNLQNQINEYKKTLSEVNKKIMGINKEIAHLNATKAVIQHNIAQKEQDSVKKNDLQKNLADLENKFTIYPHVVKSFSSVGIPNLIIQNLLDDLQIEANSLLSQLKPGLQLSFVIEKTKSDGTQDDTLEIIYMMNGRKRAYGQLSGAMKLSVIFSLKLGLSFLLQKMMGSDIRLLLLDELDQSLDKASVDAFADIVKFFQKDFTILVITHNDRLKDKFSHAVLVNQDINMISKAQVVSSW